VAGYNSFNCTGIAQVDVTVNCSGSGARISADAKPQTNDDEETSDAIVVYPNPSTGVAYIKNAPINGVVEVYNQIGQRIATNIIENGSTEINLLSHAKGIYFIKISHSGKPVYQGRVIKIE
jgi:hypothetical protein